MNEWMNEWMTGSPPCGRDILECKRGIVLRAFRGICNQVKWHKKRCCPPCWGDFGKPLNPTAAAQHYFGEDCDMHVIWKNYESNTQLFHESICLYSSHTCGVDRLQACWVVDGASPQSIHWRHVDFGVVDGNIWAWCNHNFHLQVVMMMVVGMVHACQSQRGSKE